MNRNVSQAEGDFGLHVSRGTLVFFSSGFVVFMLLYMAWTKAFIGSPGYFKYLESYAVLASRSLSAIGVTHELVATIPDLRNKKDLSKVKINEVFQNTIKDDGLPAQITVTVDSDPYIVAFILAAAVAAWPGKLRARIFVASCALIFVYAINVIAIAGMYLVDVYRPLQFDIYQSYIYPIFLLILAFGFFWVRIILSNNHPNAPALS